MTRLLTAAATALALGLPLAAPAQETPAPMSEAERAAFRAEVRTYLLENPEVIMEAIQVLEQRREAIARASDGRLVEAHAQDLFADPGDWVGGNPDGTITIVEFSDYRCGYCKRAQPIVAELLARNPDLRFVVKEFPILGPDSVAAGRMALAALEIDRDRYGALHEALMEYRGNLTEAAAYRIAGETGYDIAALKAAAASPEVEARLQKTYGLAQALGLQGTPSFVVGSQILRGFLPLEEMLAVLDTERRAAN